jgi:hypothetical protein
VASRTPEDVVRDYLRYLVDPASVEPDTADLDARIDAESDPLARVKLRSERARAQDVGPQLEAEFIGEVAGWAEGHGIDPEALLEEGVERRVLVEAGLVSGTPRRAVRSGPSARSTSRAPRVSRDAIADHVRGLRKGTSFTTATLANDAGGSVATIRKVIDALVEEGVVVEEGKDHSGPGRPRTLYQRT